MTEGKVIHFASGGDQAELVLEPGPPVACAPESQPVALQSGSAELFLRMAGVQAFLGVLEQGNVLFPALPEGAGFLLVARSTCTLAPSAPSDADCAAWCARLAQFADTDGCDPAQANARLVEAISAREAQRDAAELARLRELAQHHSVGPRPAGLSQLLSRAAAALDVTPPSPLPGDGDHGFEDTPRFAQRFGISARRVTLSGQWQTSDQGPLLLRGREDKAITLATWHSGAYRLADGTRLDREEAAMFEAGAFVLSAPLPAGLTGLRQLGLYVLRGNRDELQAIALAATLMAMIGALIPLATGWLLSDIAPSGDMALLIAVGAALLFGGMVNYLLSALRGMATSRLEGKTSARLTIAVLDRVLRLPTSFFRQHNGGDLSQRIAGIDAIRGLLLGIALSAGLSAVLSVFYFGVLLYYGVSLALIALGLVSVYIAIVAITRVVQMPLIREAFALDGQLVEQSYELVASVAKLRSAAAERRALERWASRYGEERDLEMRAGVINAYAGATSTSWQMFTTVILFAGVALLMQDSLPPGGFIAFLIAFGSFQGAFVALSTQMIALYAAQPQIERAMPILKAEPEVSEARSDPGRLAGAIEVRDVSFGYDEALPPVLSGVSLEVPAGSHLAIVGGSGSGKSTLLRLLLGFEKPRHGAILYDGKDMAELDLSLLRAQIGVVLQSSSLFAGSIIENIRGPHAAGLEQCLEAAHRAGLAKDLEGFPMGVHTPITEGASVLSGGQRQRILIARALVARPRLLFFDEATSALDNTSQAMVAETLDAMDATRITIAHRLSTIAHADTICVVGKGRILEQGSYDDLMARDGAFAALARRQLIGE